MSTIDRISEISRWANRTLFGGLNETVSSRLGKLSQQGVWWAKVCCFIISLVLLDRDHCEEAIEEPRP